MKKIIKNTYRKFQSEIIGSKNLKKNDTEKTEKNERNQREVRDEKLGKVSAIKNTVLGGKTDLKLKSFDTDSDVDSSEGEVSLFSMKEIVYETIRFFTCFLI